MKKERKLLRKQMKLLANASQGCDSAELSTLTKDMLNISFELRQASAQEKTVKGGYDGEIKLKTRIDTSAVKKFSKKIRKVNKDLKKTVHLMKEVGK